MILFFISTGLFLHNIQQGVDLALWDEALYLSSAESFRYNHLLPGTNWAPLYTVWYTSLSFIAPSPVFLYYLNTYLLTMLFPLAAFFCAVRFAVSPAIALFMSLILLTGYLNLDISPKPAHLALTLLLFFMGLSTFAPKRHWKLAIIIFGSLLGSFLRPELFLACILLTFLFVGYIVFHWKEWTKKDLPIFLLSISLAVGLLYCFGIPLLTGDDRSMMAFGQHFAQRWVGWTRSELNPQLNWERILEENFGDANSYGQLFANNPKLFSRHIWANAIEFVKNLRFVFYHYPFILPVSTMSLVGMLTMGGFGAYLLWRWKSLQENIGALSWESIAIGILCLPGAISCILIYPRMHYIIVVTVLVAIWLVILASKGFDFSGCIAIVLPITLVLWTPNAAHTLSPGLKNKRSYDFIVKHTQHPTINILESGSGFGFYFEGAHRFSIEKTNPTVAPDKFLTDNEINTVFVDYYFKKQPVYAAQPLWKSWLERDFAKNGFRKYIIHGNIIYIKSSK